jgi:hypothetical protein
MSNENGESKKVRTSDLIEGIKKIESLTNELEEVVKDFPESTVKTRYQYSVENLKKKNEDFLNAGAKKELTEDQKAAIKAIKAGKVDPEKVLSALSTPVEEVGGKSKRSKKTN